MNTCTPKDRAPRQGFSRRTFLIVAAAAAVTGRGHAADLTIREGLPPGTDPRYAHHALVGPHAVSAVVVPHPTTPLRYMIHHPQGIASSRLVLFSHDALANPGVYRPLLGHWASHGFTVVAPLHRDSVILEGLRARHEDAWGTARWEIGALLADADGWKMRATDFLSVLDLVPILSRTLGLKVDAERPIAVGHGLGAHVAQALAGAHMDVDGESLSLADERIYAAALLSPFGAGVLGLGEDSWSEVETPLLVVVGGRDSDATEQEQERRKDSFRLSAPGYKHLAFLPEAGHGAYSGAPAAGAHVYDVRAVTTAWLGAYADHDSEAYAEIMGGLFERATQGRVEMDYR